DRPRRRVQGTRTGQDADKVHLCRATWGYATHPRPGPERRLRAALDRPDDDPLVWYVAWGHLTILRHELAAGEALSLGVSDREVRAWLDARTAHVDAARAELDALIRLDQVWFVLDGLDRFGHHFVDLADDLLAAPEPPGLSAVSRSIFHANVESRAEDQLVKARGYYQLGVDLALRVSWEGPEAAALRDQVDALTARVEAMAPP
ncbi:MAG TPA: hypothetical protein PKA64_23500, partial [Myxococcota bacterium]|nr:hypothetical protein [Myxococcota bacterium]